MEKDHLDKGLIFTIIYVLCLTAIMIVIAFNPSVIPLLSDSHIP